jgi:hypothetical protein
MKPEVAYCDMEVFLDHYLPSHPEIVNSVSKGLYNKRLLQPRNPSSRATVFLYAPVARYQVPKLRDGLVLLFSKDPDR